MTDIQKTPEHVNPIERSIKEHVAATGDIYVTKNPGQYTELYRLDGRDDKYPNCFRVTRLDPLTGEAVKEDGGYKRDRIEEDQLRQYYRYLSHDLAETLSLARKVMDGDTAAVRKAVLGDEGEETPEPSDMTALTSGRPAGEISEMLLHAEIRQNRLQEIQMAAELMATAKRNELDRKLREMNGVLDTFRKKVQDLVRVVTILNLYLGKEVAVEQIADGEAADASEPLHVRQRILFMDEELCAHIDHEADCNDIDLFLQWLREPGNRDIVVPEQRCIVAVKPKRFEMGYRSGDPWYDAEREQWNKHTYLILRNGEKLYVVDSDDLECWDWVFPHKDHETAYAEKMSNPATSFKDSLSERHKNTNYRVMKFAAFVQGIIDHGEVMGSFEKETNLLKMKNVVLVRDDEDVLGTGLAPFREFQEQKNRLLRRGKRVIYVPSRPYKSGVSGRSYYSSGEYRRYYTYESSEPGVPGEGIYSLRQDEDTPNAKFWFSFLPGGVVWPKNIYEESHERRRREGWIPKMDYILNYDDTTSEELQAYFNDRTKRIEFRDMMPILKRALLEKRREEASENAFINLMLHELHEEEYCCGIREEDVREAIKWWKEKVIFTRPLTKDDAKAWRMIKKHLQ